MRALAALAAAGFLTLACSGLTDGDTVVAVEIVAPPEVVVGVARAGVIPGAVVASILRVEFASVTLRRSQIGEAPSLISRPTQSPRGRRVLLVDSTCESGDTLRLALSVLKEEGAKQVKSAVTFRTGEFAPDFAAMQTTAFIILPWDRDVIEGQQLVMRPDYVTALRQAGRA